MSDTREDNPFSLSVDDADMLSVVVVLSPMFRVQVLDHMRRQMGDAAFGRLFAEFIGLANRVVENNRVMLTEICEERGITHPDSSVKPNLPSIFGALHGVVIADGIDETKLCGGCAFRIGTPANQCHSTIEDALYCGEPGERPFMCHEHLDERGEPTRACAGWAQFRAKSNEEAGL